MNKCLGFSYKVELLYNLFRKSELIFNPLFRPSAVHRTMLERNEMIQEIGFIFLLGGNDNILRSSAA